MKNIFFGTPRFSSKIIQNVAGYQNKQENLALCHNVILTPIDTKNVKNATKKNELSMHTKVNILYVIPKINKMFSKQYHHLFNGFGRQVWDFEIPPAAVGIPKRTRLIPELNGVS